MTSKTVPISLLKDPRHFLSLGFGSGLAPKAPGTFGTLAAIPVYLFMALFMSDLIYITTIVLAFFLGIYLCQQTTNALGVDDHPAIVWDEFVGYFITMLFVPLTLTTVVLGFFFFRIFDILKPWPISVIDSRIKGGLGVMLDDVLAGCFALAAMHLCLWLFY